MLSGGTRSNIACWFVHALMAGRGWMLSSGREICENKLTVYIDTACERGWMLSGGTRNNIACWFDLALVAGRCWMLSSGREIGESRFTIYIITACCIILLSCSAGAGCLPAVVH